MNILIQLQKHIGPYQIVSSIIKRSLQYHLYLLMVILFRIFVKKKTFSITSICTPIKHNSRLPPFIYKTKTRIHCFYVTDKDILSIINSLNSSKAHGYFNISIKIIQIYNESITIPLKIIFEESLKKVIFPDIWKKGNNIPAHEKRQNFNK